MKYAFFSALIVVGALVYFRSGRRWGNARRRNLIALFIFILMLAGMIGLVLLALKLF